MSPIQRVVTSGTFVTNGGAWDVDNHIWIVGDDTDAIAFVGAHTAEPIIDAVAAGMCIEGVRCGAVSLAPLVRTPWRYWSIPCRDTDQSVRRKVTSSTDCENLNALNH